MATETTNLESKLAELDQLKARVAALEGEVTRPTSKTAWVPDQYYTTYHLLAGMVLGFVAALTSLLYNVVGATLFGKNSLEIIRVYLTFPMGEKALSYDTVQDGFALAAGCCLYLATGIIGGIPFHLILTKYFAKASFARRLIVSSILGVGVWVINYYCILSWLQPMLVGGNWIVERVPPFVAVTTHLVFGWTMMLVGQWGSFVPPTASKE